MNIDIHKHTNALINETSPYLLQHAHNPVNWNAWGQEALDQAKRENKLLIISVGYSACHWCHVMEHESFEDSTVAELMNEHFISIKVDREERPDIDDIYMTACNLISGRGGWPLNAVALPDGSPVWAGTYFPKDDWINVLNQFINLKNNDYPKLEEAAKNLVMGIKQSDAVVDVPSDGEFTEEELTRLGEKFITNTDFEFGGIKSTQKFPLPGSYEFLLKYAYKFPESKALQAVEITLNGMMKGGIYDHVEGGFARYTVDQYWKIPHFEKMLYDNSQLIGLYSQAYKLTKNKAYKRVVEESISFMESNWKDNSGGYYSSFDADSEGVEGKFYIWTKEELSAIIPKDEMEEFAEYYNVTADGNWEESNILYVDKDAPAEQENFLAKKARWRSLILAERKKRVYPGLDDKLICVWNAMMISGYSEAYKAFGDESYRTEALSIWSFIERDLLDANGLRLNRNYKDGKSTINAFLDDYAQVISALVNLYQITFDEAYLQKADSMMEYVIDHFKNETSSMFNFTSDLDPPLVATKSELTDGAVPGSNSVTARNLQTLGLLLYKKDYLTLSKQMILNMKDKIDESNQPNFYANWCNLYFDMVYDPYEVAILGPNYERLRDELLANYHPNALFLGGSSEGGLKLLESKLQEDEDYIYVCVNKACKLPVQTSMEALGLLD